MKSGGVSKSVSAAMAFGIRRGHSVELRWQEVADSGEREES